MDDNALYPGRVNRYGIALMVIGPKYHCRSIRLVLRHPRTRTPHSRRNRRARTREGDIDIEMADSRVSIQYRLLQLPQYLAILINNLLDPNPLRARLLLGMSILQVVFALISVILIFAQCRPTAALWDHSIAGDCWPQSVFYDFNYWVSAYTTMTDIVLAIVPISVFWRLQMKRGTKVGVCIMMGLTLLSAVVTIVKATYLHLFTDAEDPLYNMTPLVIWGLIEQNVVIVAACIPTLRPFFRRAFESRGSSNNTSRGRSGSAIKLSSNPTHGSKRLASVSVDERRGHNHTHGTMMDTVDDEESASNSSLQGIWQTREVIVESDNEGDREWR
ncbi:hypothetical protein BJY04DRAFT_38753 [Aspergillus karnatakaensis]|uniref:uncharacterized protein n=1 Tax=Aspergillus karnatakaensis TaxID=1810916 RepID=UPI003CCD7B57